MIGRLLPRVGALGLCGLAACAPEVGPCAEPALAAELVYRDLPEGHRERGQPAYAGQALIIASCGAGSWCHAEDATGARRLGVPAGLDFDLRLACPDAPCDPAAVARLGEDRRRLQGHGAATLRTLELGSMPPPSPGGDPALALGGRWRRAGGSLLPAARSAEGQRLVRAWLACGAPVVERTEPATPPQQPGSPCDLPTLHGACRRSASDVLDERP